MLGYFFALKVKLILIIAILLSCFHSRGQDSIRVKKPKEFFIGIGSGHYRGDLNSSYGPGKALLTVGIKLNTAKRLNGNFVLNIGSLSGNELDYTFDDGSNIATTPNSYFNTSFFSINYETQYNIINRKKLKLYISQGIGVLRFIPRDEFGNDLIDNNDTRALNETYGNLAIMFPTSLGLKYVIPNGMGIGFQTGLFNSISDYIDNISEWGQDSGNDNILNFRIQLSVPINL